MTLSSDFDDRLTSRNEIRNGQRSFHIKSAFLRFQRLWPDSFSEWEDTFREGQWMPELL